MFCSNCGTQVADGTLFCPECGTRLNVVREGNVVSRAASTIGQNVVNQVTAMYGTQEQVDLKFGDFFCEVPKKHTHEEAEQIFICGTSTTTPDIRDAGRTWPKPWLYSRVLFLLAATFLGCMILSSTFHNPKGIPGFIVVGSFMVPIATMIFFFEANAPRNISFMEVLKMFLLGGVGSILAIYPLSAFIQGAGSGALIPAMLTGLIEELAKLALVAYFMRKRTGRNYILTGLLIGSAVGAGFAAFESAGYAFENFLDPWISIWSNGYQLESTEELRTLYTLGYNGALDVVILRGVLAVGGHVAWAAVEGAGIAIVSEGRAFEWVDLLKKEFLLLFAFPVVCHGIWDWQPIEQYLGVPFGDLILLIAIIWVLLLVLLRRGIVEVNHMANEPQPAMSVVADGQQSVPTVE